MRAIGKRLVVYLAVIVLIFGVGCMFLENKMLYHPTRYPVGNWDAPAQAGIPVEDVQFTAADGVSLHGWYLPGNKATTTLLYFHGNGGNLSDRFGWVVDLSRLPANVFIIDYRGYGTSTVRRVARRSTHDFGAVASCPPSTRA